MVNESMNSNRIISGALTIIYLAIAYQRGGPAVAIKVAIFLVLPLACIWFTATVVNYFSHSTNSHGKISTPGASPCRCIRILGWILLLLPILLVVFH
jgi:hypothetical protein